MQYAIGHAKSFELETYGSDVVYGQTHLHWRLRLRCCSSPEIQSQHRRGGLQASGWEK
jgi:hypothetical protein